MAKVSVNGFEFSDGLGALSHSDFFGRNEDLRRVAEAMNFS